MPDWLILVFAGVAFTAGWLLRGYSGWVRSNRTQPPPSKIPLQLGVFLMSASPAILSALTDLVTAFGADKAAAVSAVQAQLTATQAAAAQTEADTIAAINAAKPSVDTPVSTPDTPAPAPAA